MEDLKDAMRQRDDRRKTTIRSILAAIKQAETELDASGQRKSLGEDDVLDLIARQAKQRRESIAEYERGGRADLVAEEEAELAILETYLPRQLSDAEIRARAEEVIAETGASGLGDIGQVMRPLMTEFKGRADGRQVNQIVRELLVG
jgi:uncharacterized protein YqeY